MELELDTSSGKSHYVNPVRHLVHSVEALWEEYLWLRRREYYPYSEISLSKDDLKKDKQHAEDFLAWGEPELRLMRNAFESEAPGFFVTETSEEELQMLEESLGLLRKMLERCTLLSFAVQEHYELFRRELVNLIHLDRLDEVGKLSRARDLLFAEENPGKLGEAYLELVSWLKPQLEDYEESMRLRRLEERIQALALLE